LKSPTRTIGRSPAIRASSACSTREDGSHAPAFVSRCVEANTSAAFARRSRSVTQLQARDPKSFGHDTL